MTTQTRLGSLLESFLAASIAAPTAIFLNDIMLQFWGNNLVDPNIKNTYLLISWISFFFHSMAWKYILRRLFVKYGWEPKNILNYIRSKK